jgi:hypothetical protein
VITRVGRNRFIAPLCDAVARCTDAIACSEVGVVDWRNKAIAPCNRPIVVTWNIVRRPKAEPTIAVPLPLRARQYAEPLRTDFGAFLRVKGFCLD